jgi:hypothetical protein
LYLTGTGSASAPECLGFDQKDQETDKESLPSLEELLDRNKTPTGVMVRSKLPEQQMATQAPDSIDTSILERTRRVANGGNAQSSTISAPENFKSPDGDILITSAGARNSTDVRGEDYLVTAKNNSAVNHRSPSTVSDTSVDKAGRPCVEVESENTKTVAELKKHEAEQENCDSPEGDNVSEGYTRSYDGDGSNYVGELRTDDSDSDSDNDLGSKESENE